MDCGSRKRLNGSSSSSSNNSSSNATGSGFNSGTGTAGGSGGGGGGTNTNQKPTSVEDQALSQITKEAEAKLIARRQARAEAREIRLRELERLQREQEENADKSFELASNSAAASTPINNDVTISRITSKNCLLRGSQFSSRRSSEDSLEDGLNFREMRHELQEFEEKFRKAMITNAQLDNEKSACTYQIELLKDRIEELEDELFRIRRDFKDSCRERDQLKRSIKSLQDDLNYYQFELKERDRMISEYGLTIVSNQEFLENGFENESANDSCLSSNSTPFAATRCLVKAENAQILKSAGHGTLDVRLQRLVDDKCELEEEVNKLKAHLDEERKLSHDSLLNNNLNLLHSVGLQNGLDPDCDPNDIQREIAKQLADYKFRTQKAEQDVATLQTTVSRLESQVIRYKSASEVSEKAENELKSEKRKLQREARESQSRVEELETENNYLKKRLEKLKVAKSTLLKEL